MTRHIFIKLVKIKHKQKVLKTASEKQKLHKGILIRLIADLSTETAGQKGVSGYT